MYVKFFCWRQVYIFRELFFIYFIILLINKSGSMHFLSNFFLSEFDNFLFANSLYMYVSRCKFSFFHQ